MRVLERDRARTALSALFVASAVALLSQFPVLMNPSFYFWDDSAAQFLPMWHRLGERILAGQWPLMLDVDSWMGGNLAAESLFGIWNPINLLDYLVVVWVGDLAVAATLVKTQFLVTLGLGVFALCRDYGADRRAASVLGVALPVSGFVLYFQAGTWAGGLMGFAWVPWAWWGLRRSIEGRVGALVPFVFGYLCVSAGDPYGLLALCSVFIGLLVESIVGKQRIERSLRIRRLALNGTLIAGSVPLIFLPVLLTNPVSWRSGFELFNLGKLAPGLSDVLNLSLPSFVPQIISFGSFRMSVPAMYFAWFVVPLLAWLDWRWLARNWRRYAAATVLAIGYLLLCLGPSNVWMFRWPLRHIAVFYLALSVLLASVLTQGLCTDRFRARLGFTSVGLLLSAYLSFAAWPSQAVKHLASLVAIYVLLAWVLAVRHSRVAPLLHLGTACMLLLQTLWFPANRDVAFYNFPTNIKRLRADFVDLRGRTTVQIADRGSVESADVISRAAWKDMLFGNMYAAVGVPSLVAYSGIGYRALRDRLCLSYYGSMCRRAFSTLWSRDETGLPLVDQLKAARVTVQRNVIDNPVPPVGWRVAKRNSRVTVLAREAPIPWRNGRLSGAPGVMVTSNTREGQHKEKVRYVHGSRGQLIFARLAWPGYRATVNGRRIPVDATSAGLLRVNLPAWAHSGLVRITWSPPGFGASATSAGSGFLAAVMLSARRWRRLRERTW